MKSKQKGEVVLLTAAAYLIAGFAMIVVPHSLKKAEAKPEPVCHNYNNIGCK